MGNLDLIIHVDEKDSGCTIGNLLRRKKGFSRALVRKLKRSGGIRCNGTPVFMGEKVTAGDVLVVTMPGEEPTLLEPEEIPLDIVFEDQDILAVNKPAGMLVHPVKWEQSGTLANAVLYYWREAGITGRFRPVYRLDRDTSGIVLVALSQYAAQQLAAQLEKKLLRRRYLAVVVGTPPNAGRIDLPLGLKPGHSAEWMVTPGGRPAITHYRLLGKLGNGRTGSSVPAFSLLCLELETGRTHQIRVHMSHIGHPLLGDARYGGDEKLFHRQALHAAAIDFYHPRTGVPVKLRTPVPADMRELVRLLRSRESEFRNQ
ncbi:23S rRNA pseudouridine1911/1915/1917 synthase [Desulfotomaculum arcticum]|uniref:Pseudouridine synthase n=1 Tax=Desulfotruncus arcticus DSM 17038 TaxID=1121424 RepID=A0A1I2USR7_9FIRM|nr:RluA family pseudouridine synthase [Desulfotruncus arcticus]SFG77996.1 23S rRNA pseudouridine1911/1915/1917 synthase [Desulfotomaculum arcticum] [Desulfotruncus arcticus DSM 17038]